MCSVEKQVWLLIRSSWVNSVLLQNSPWRDPQQSVQNPNRLVIIDWENVQYGHRAIDIGGMLADLYERKHFRGVAASHDTGWPPRAVTMALSTPIWSPCRKS